jgi:3',5'-cyclic-AMP phosphodiesterase
LKGKLRRWWYRLTAVAAVAALALLAITALVGLRAQRAGRGAILGNRPGVVEKLVAKTDPNDFTFFVMGDTKRGTATMEHLLSLARQDRAAFAVIVGDFVGKDETARHDFFMSEIAGLKLPFPVLLVPGNHDTYPGAPADLAAWEQAYGPAQFNFTIGRCLFVFLNDAPPYDESGQYLAYLERAVRERGPQVDSVFVFMHVPPTGLNSWIEARKPEGSGRFLQLAKDLSVTYVFAGDHHGYVKTVKDGTNFIVTGGGGDRLRGEHGAFHHATRMAVNKDMITETVVAVENSFSGVQNAKEALAVYVWPLITRSAVTVVGTLVLAALAMWTLGASHRRLKAMQQLAAAPAVSPQPPAQTGDER